MKVGDLVLWTAPPGSAGNDHEKQDIGIVTALHRVTEEPYAAIYWTREPDSSAEFCIPHPRIQVISETY